MDPITPQPEQPQYGAPISPMPPMSQGPKHFGPKTMGTIVAVVIIGGAAYAGVWWWGNRSYCIDPIDCGNRPTSGSTDLTADWKTYTNTQYGFEFKYPPTWILSPSSGNNIQVSDVDISKVTEVGSVFYVSLDSDPFPDEYKSWRDGDLVMGGGRVGFFKNVNFNDKKITIGMSAGSVIIKDIEDKILSTFKFTNSVDTSTWKTYTNTQYGYSFKYPDGYVVSAGLSGADDWVQVYSSKPDSSGHNLTILDVATVNVGRESVFDSGAKPICEIITISFGGRTAKECVAVSQDSISRYIKLVQTGGLNWQSGNEIWYSINDQKSPSLISYANQILSTFKFTK